jgi:hypothetical protein
MRPGAISTLPGIWARLAETDHDVLLKLRDRALEKIRQLKYSDFWHGAKIRKAMSLTPAQKSARGIRRTVRLLSNFPGLWQRTIEQTPDGGCQWGGTLFVAEGEADYYVILNSIRRPADSPYLPRITLPNPSRVWGLHMEPEGYVRLLGYDDPQEHALTSRFYTNCEYLIARGGIYRPSPPYVHFHIGKSWDFLSAAPEPRKTIELGIISSGLKTIEGHKARLDFLEELDASDLDCAIWGRGDNLAKLRKYRGFAPSKWDVHAACRYSIVIENSVAPWYWSEKPADALLGWSLPLYHGCPELGRFLRPDGFQPIDIAKPGRIPAIRAILKDTPYQERLAAIAQARQTLLNRENVYAFLDRELNAL